MLALDIIVHLIGEDVLASLLLSDTLFQPVLCAILGLVPSCAMSVLLSELFCRGHDQLRRPDRRSVYRRGVWLHRAVSGSGGPPPRASGHRGNTGGRHSRRHADPAPIRLTKRVSPFRGGRFFMPSPALRGWPHSRGAQLSQLVQQFERILGPTPCRCVQNRRPACKGSF